MHLTVVDEGHRLKHRLLLKLLGLVMRSEPPDVLKVMFYRPKLFGDRFGELCQSVLRGSSEWSVSERELFAAFTSRLNACRF
jgi:hypothetical protein